MGKTKINKEELIEILTKLARGYYYTEEQVEIQKPQNNISNIKISDKNIKNLSFFDNYVTVESDIKNTYDKIKSDSYETQINKENTETSFTKKKIATHYIQPDISAIKILLEICEKEMKTNEISNLTDNELLKLKDKIIKELSNEN